MRQCSSEVEQRFRNLEPKVPFHRVPYRLVQSNCSENHDRCGQLLVSVVWHKRQTRRQNQQRLGDELHPTLALPLHKSRELPLINHPYVRSMVVD